MVLSTITYRPLQLNGKALDLREDHMKVVVSHPFSGALYAFFAQYNPASAGPVRPRPGHPYYRTLYGDAFPRYQEMALTLILLFDQIVLVPADAYLPGGFWATNRVYDNPQLGLYTEWDFDVQREIDDGIGELLKDPVISSVLSRVPPLSQHQILRDCRVEIHLAQKFSCPIVCVGGRRKIIDRILQAKGNGPAPYDATALTCTEEYLRLVGPIFSPRDLETLVDLRADRDLKTYAKTFTSAMLHFRTSADPRAELLVALREAIGSAKLAGKISAVFDGTATAVNYVGLIPVLGTAASLVGIGADAASRALDHRKTSQSWYEFAAQVKRVTSLKQLERKISLELAAREREV